MRGKIIKAIAGFYYIDAEDGRLYACRARGIFRKDKQKPLVGDNVNFEVLSETELEGSLCGIDKRKNVLIRPAAANVDQALVVFAVREPDPNLNLLDRFLIYMGMQDIPVIICFNKEDLDKGGAARRYKEIYEAAGYRVILGSVREALPALSGKDFVEKEKRETIEKQEGFDQSRETEQEGTAGRAQEPGAETKKQDLNRAVLTALFGKTTVLAGPSGVGKSSLTNLLHAEEKMEVGALSERIKRGKQTTRHTELFALGGDTYLLDTPGFTSLEIPEAVTSEDLRIYFDEFKPYIPECKFMAGCRHIHEKEAICGVKRAVERGEIAKERYENYVQIYEELKERERR